MISLADLLEASRPDDEAHRDGWTRLLAELNRLNEIASRYTLIPSSDLAIIVEAFRDLSTTRAENGAICVLALREMVLALDPGIREILADMIVDRPSRRPLELRTEARRYLDRQMSDPGVKVLFMGLDDAPHDVLNALRAIYSAKLLGLLQPKACMALAETVSRLLYGEGFFGSVNRFTVSQVPEMIRGRRVSNGERWQIIDRYAQSSSHTFDDASQAGEICALINRNRLYGDYYASLGMISLHLELLNQGNPGRPLLEGAIQKVSGLKRDLVQMLREAESTEAVR